MTPCKGLMHLIGQGVFLEKGGFLEFEEVKIKISVQ